MKFEDIRAGHYYRDLLGNKLMALEPIAFESEGWGWRFWRFDRKRDALWIRAENVEPWGFEGEVWLSPNGLIFDVSHSDGDLTSIGWRKIRVREVVE